MYILKRCVIETSVADTAAVDAMPVTVLAVSHRLDDSDLLDQQLTTEAYV